LLWNVRTAGHKKGIMELDRKDIVLTTINAKWIHPSLGLRLLKANLGALEDRCRILEFALRQPLCEKTDAILAARPLILGISAAIWNHRPVLELLGALEEVWAGGGKGMIPRPVVILGGPEVSHLPPESELIQRADWVVRGEGEAVFRELCELILGNAGGETAAGSSLPSALPSSTEISGNIISAKPVDLSVVDPAYRLYTSEDLHRKLVYVEASRGCPFGCEFCLSSLDKEVREFPPDRFLEEMNGLIRRGARTFKFLDRTFNLNIERARRILEFFLEKAGQSDCVDPPLCVHFEMVPLRFPPELREVLTRFPPGTLRLEVGIQTFNRETAALIGRPSAPETELETLRFLWNQTNAIIHADLIAGLPGEDLGSFGEGFDRLWIVLSNPDCHRGQARAEIQPGILKFLPGTPIKRHNEKYGMRYASAPPYEVLETGALPSRELDRIKNFARFWEIIVNRGVFRDLGPALFPEGQPVFQRFMELSDRLFARFGRNWGIDQKELRAYLVSVHNVDTLWTNSI
jgi:radical SAM superfamily enzyme YgiQ (UPF0313 family)